MTSEGSGERGSLFIIVFIIAFVFFFVFYCDLRGFGEGGKLV